MWPFKKKQQNIKAHQKIDDYRICFFAGVYTIQKYYKLLDQWKTLHYYQHTNEYISSARVYKKYVLSFKTLREARNKVSELIPQYFSAKTPDSSYY